MAYIPKPEIHDDTAVNQHLVPRCYMKEWTHNSAQTKVWLYKKVSELAEVDLEQVTISCKSENTKYINAIDNYYDIKAGCYFMPPEALEEIFGPTMHLNVICKDENLDTTEKRNERFGLFDEWVIIGEEGNKLTEDEVNSLRDYFSETRFVFIEKEWDRQYESKWRTYIKDFERKVRQSKIEVDNGIKTQSIVTSDMISEIIKFMIVFDVRGFYTDEYINEQIDAIWDILPVEISEMQLEQSDRMHPLEKTVRECFRHQFILHLCYDILKNNKMSGIVETMWKSYKDHLVPRFCLTDIKHPFVTSERPVFINELKSGGKEQIFVALPTMLISFGRGDKGQFFISNLSADEVDEYNKVIVRNNEYIISYTNNIDVNTLWDI